MNQKIITKENILVGQQTTAQLVFSFDFDMRTAGIIFEEMGKIENISYEMVYALKNTETYKKEALALAVKNARETADLLAISAGTKVIATHEITYGQTNTFTRSFKGSIKETAMLDCASAIEDLSVEDLIIREDVSIVFEIE